jgi:hypothetical protein
MIRIKLSALAATICALMFAVPLTAAGGNAAKTAKITAVRSAWPPETLSGKIAMVNPGQRLVVIQTQDGVTYDPDVIAKTQIHSGGQSIALKDLTRDLNKTASVRIIPDRRGDIAEVIQIKG